MNKKHKHAEIIKAWADGAEIEYTDFARKEWNPICAGWSWDDLLVADYRIKPKPDVIEETHIVYEFECNDWTLHPTKKPNIRFCFDGETGKPKSAEVIK